MSGKQTSGPLSVLDHVGERVRQGFGTIRLETNNSALPELRRRGVDPDRLAALLENHAISTDATAERRP
jgi:hypothetical protein